MAGGKNRDLLAILRTRSKGGVDSCGYTILEVMLFLAISGIMFIMAANFINGKQSEVEFRQGLNAVNSTINGVINDVSNGENQQYNNLHCASAGIGLHPTISTVATPQGTNNGCVFMGKVIQFNVSDTNLADANHHPASDNGRYFNIYTIVGNMTDATTGLPVNSFPDAYPVAVDYNSGDGVTASPVNLTQTQALEDGIQVTKVLSCTSACTQDLTTKPSNSGYSGNVPAIGFFGSFNNCGSSGSQTQSGSQSVVTTTLPIAPGNYGATEQTMAAQINSSAKGIGPSNYIGSCNTTVSNSFILLCFQVENRIGSIVIGGGNGQQFTTNIVMGDSLPKACTT